MEDRESARDRKRRRGESKDSFEYGHPYYKKPHFDRYYERSRTPERYFKYR